MFASDPLEDYPLPYQEFYAELPGSIDYLNEIDPTIHDEHDTQSSTGGLSDEQVSQIAEDSLNPSLTSPFNRCRTATISPHLRSKRTRKLLIFVLLITQLIIGLTVRFLFGILLPEGTQSY